MGLIVPATEIDSLVAPGSVLQIKVSVNPKYVYLRHRSSANSWHFQSREELDSFIAGLEQAAQGVY